MALLALTPGSPELALAASALSRARPTSTRALDEDTLAAYLLVEDVRGGHYLIFRVELRRDIHQRGLLAWRALLGSVLVARSKRTRAA